MNARDGRGTTPLAVAAGVGHCDVLKVLIEHPNAQLNAQVNCCMNIRFCHVHAYIHNNYVRSFTIGVSVLYMQLKDKYCMRPVCIDSESCKHLFFSVQKYVYVSDVFLYFSD